MRYYRNCLEDLVANLLDLATGKSRVVRLSNHSDRMNRFVSEEVADLERLIAAIKAAGAQQARDNAQAIGNAVMQAITQEAEAESRRLADIKAAKDRAAARIRSYEAAIRRTNAALKIELSSMNDRFDTQRANASANMTLAEEAAVRAEALRAQWTPEPAPTDEAPTAEG